MEDPIRVRVVFEDRNLLSKSQRMDGLKRSWFLLKAGMVTISDISHHLMKRFKLKRSCPDGLLLSMDDFVLPPFESACILKDKDTIRVRKKVGTLVDVINAGNVQQYIQDSGIVERKLSQELLAITEFQEDSGLHQSGHEKDSSLPNENTIHTRNPSSEKIKSKTKRKHSDNALDSKGKKLKLSNSEIPAVSTEIDDDIHSGQGGCFSYREKHSNRDGGSNALSISQVEDTVEKMHSHVPKEAKRKKSKLNRPGKSIVATEIADNVEQNKSYEKGESSHENLQRKHKASIKYCNSVVPVDSILEHTLSKLPSSVPTEERRDKPEENNACDPHANDSSTKQLRTRNARRKIKQAKRKWLRGIMSQDNKDQTDNHPPNDTHKKSTEHQEKVLTSEMQEEIVPIVVRPGHIRFEPLDEHSLCQSQGAMETVRWNGTTSKKKGQKWGRENNFGKSNDAKHFKEQYNRNSDDAVGWKNNGENIGEGWKGNEKSIAEGLKSNGKSDAGVRISNGKSITEHFGKDSTGGKMNEKSISEAWPTNENSDAGMKNKGKSIVEEGKSDRCIDYESLFPLTRIPQKGDLLVYRLVELSSSWCPEVSPFRVGKVSSYDPISLRIILVPVPEYPILCHEDVDGEESMDQVNVSAYKEDGSLEVLYPSLVDVRLLKANDVEASTGEHDDKEMPGIEVTPMNNSDQALADENGKEIATPNVTSPIDGQSTWEEIKQALSEKKAELQKNNDNTNLGECSPRKSTATTSWSYRGLRGSPMGPTLAFLRGNNVLDPTS